MKVVRVEIIYSSWIETVEEDIDAAFINDNGVAVILKKSGEMITTTLPVVIFKQPINEADLPLAEVPPPPAVPGLHHETRGLHPGVGCVPGA